METQSSSGHSVSHRKTIAVLSVIFLSIAGIALIDWEDSDAAQTEKTLYLVPGFKQTFLISGEVKAAGNATIDFKIDQSTEAGRQLVKTDVSDKFTVNGDKSYRYYFAMNYKNPNLIKNGETAKVTITVTDSTHQKEVLVYNFKAVIPDFTVSPTTKTVVKGQSSDIGATLVDSGALDPAYAVQFVQTMKLVKGTVPYNVTLSNGHITIPPALEKGVDDYHLELEIKGPGEKETVTKTYKSDNFKLDVREIPKFTLQSKYVSVQGDRLEIPLNLNDNSVKGTWTVTKDAGAPEEIVYDGSGSGTAFSINQTTVSESGNYTVQFVDEKGIKSAKVKFQLSVLAPSSSGVVNITGLVDVPGAVDDMQVGKTTNKSNVKVNKTTGFRFEVRDSAGKVVTDSFVIDTSGFINLNSSVTPGKYSLRFFASGDVSVQEVKVNLLFVEPPTIKDVAPSAGFQVS